MFKHPFFHEMLFRGLKTQFEEFLMVGIAFQIFLETRFSDDPVIVLAFLTKAIPEVNAQQKRWQHSIGGRRLMRMKTSNQQEPDPATCSAKKTVNLVRETEIVMKL